MSGLKIRGTYSQITKKPSTFEGGLSVYTSHGQIQIDNNLVENAIRPIAVGYA